jgi:hypothetical protein
MILALDSAKILYIFSSEKDVYKELEAIDIANGEYQFCDEKGRRYSAHITRPVTFFRQGTFAITVQDHDPALPLAFLDQARELGRGILGISTMSELRQYIVGNKDWAKAEHSNLNHDSGD